jgi:hypothetical protein
LFTLRPRRVPFVLPHAPSNSERDGEGGGGQAELRM